MLNIINLKLGMTNYAIWWTIVLIARSRFAIKTIVNPFTAENLISAIEDSVKKSAEQEGAKVGEIKETEKYTKKDYLEIIKPYVTKLWGVCQEDVTRIIECELGEGIS